MRGYTLDELDQSLRTLGLKPGDTVMMHSALFALGRLKGIPTASYPARIYETIRGVIGDEGTLVVPAFNFGFCRGRVFDRQRTPADGMGNLSEYVRTLPGAHRSPHPMQSVAAVGPMAEKICRPDTTGAFDIRGAFSMLLDCHARLLLLGCGFVWAAIAHYVEERVGVPYRFWKNFTGTYRDAACESIRTYSLYARDLEANPNVDPTPVGLTLLDEGLARQVRLGRGLVQCTSCRDFVDVGLRLLREDRLALIHSRSLESFNIGP
ncbi:MAG: AAC(3) family N-acetyltransferase [Bradymonadaceae bacterium]